MQSSYIEPKGWGGTPGKWALSALNGHAIRLGDPTPDTRYIEFWPSQYAGHEAQLQADMAAVGNVKELIKAIMPFAEAAAAQVTTDMHAFETTQIRVPVSALLGAIAVIAQVMPDIKSVSKPYNPEGIL